MVDKTDEMIKAVAVKHGIAIGRDDPIMVLQTINDRLMEESASSQKEILDHFKGEIEEIAHRWGEDAKNKAERTLRAALEASQEVMAQSLGEVVQEVATTVKDEIDTGASQLAVTVRGSHTVAIMNMVAAGMTLFAAGLALWMTLSI